VAELMAVLSGEHRTITTPHGNRYSSVCITATATNCLCKTSIAPSLKASLSNAQKALSVQVRFHRDFSAGYLWRERA